MSLITSVLLPAFEHKTAWQFTSSSGGSLGGWSIGGGGGTLYLANTSTREERTLRYFAGGASLGPLAGGGSFSTADMWSVGLGNIRAARESLAFGDMKGPMCILGLSGAGMASVPEGLSLSMYFLGFSVVSGLTSLLGGPLVALLNGLTAATAFGMMAGHIKGTDVGLSLQTGWAF